MTERLKLVNTTRRTVVVKTAVTTADVGGITTTMRAGTSRVVMLPTAPHPLVACDFHGNESGVMWVRRGHDAVRVGESAAGALFLATHSI